MKYGYDFLDRKIKKGDRILYQTDECLEVGSVYMLFDSMVWISKNNDKVGQVYNSIFKIEEDMKMREDNSEFKDILGQPLKVGDEVLINNKKYSELSPSEIIGFTSKKIKVRGESITHSGVTETLCNSNQVVLITPIKETKPELFL